MVSSLFFDLDGTVWQYPADASPSAVPLLMPDVCEVLGWLKSRYRLYVLSNGSRSVQLARLCATGLHPYFRDIILSEDIGVRKPFAPIFHFALSVAQCEARRALMIGDSWANDVEGAAGAGMGQVFFNPGKLPMPFPPTYDIACLGDLMRLF